MFKEINQMMGKATISLTIAVTGQNEMTVSVTPRSEGVQIAPGIIVGSPEELDSKFAEAISGLLQDSATFILKTNAAKESMKEKAVKKDDKKVETKTAQTELVSTPKESVAVVDPKKLAEEKKAKEDAIAIEEKKKRELIVGPVLISDTISKGIVDYAALKTGEEHAYAIAKVREITLANKVSADIYFEESMKTDLEAAIALLKPKPAPVAVPVSNDAEDFLNDFL